MQTKNQWYSAILSLVSLLATVYALSFTGKPISDDEQLFASVARNIAVLDKISAEQLYGNLRLRGDYRGVEPAHPVFASLWLKLFDRTYLGKVQLLYFLPILYTILTCILIVAIARQMRYSIRAGLFVALVYGLSTLAWPYAKTFLREPLIVLLLLAAWLSYLKGQDTAGYQGTLHKFLFLFFILFVVFVKVVYAIVWFAFIGMYALDKYQNETQIFSRKIRVSLLIGILLVVALLFFTSHFTDANVFYRFSGGLLRDGYLRLRSTSHMYFWSAIFASLASPVKGLLFYSPFIVLAFISLAANWKKHPQLFILQISLLFTLVLVQASIYDSGWWTPTWGSRFLLPVIAPLCVASLPVVEDMLCKGGYRKAVLIGLFTIGVLIQLPAILFNSSKFFVMTYDFSSHVFSKTLWNFLQAPYIIQWRLTKIPEYDLLLWRVFPEYKIIVLALLIGSIIFLVYSIRWLYLDCNSSTEYLKSLPHRFVISSVFLLSLYFSIHFLGGKDPFYHALDFKPICDKMRNEVKANDVVVLYSYPSYLWDFFFNVECGQSVWYSLPYGYFTDSESQSYQMAEGLLSILDQGRYSRIWFIGQYDSNSPSKYEWAIFNNKGYRVVDEGHFRNLVPVYFVVSETK